VRFDGKSLLPLIREERASNYKASSIHHRVQPGWEHGCAAGVEADRRPGAGFPLSSPRRAVQPDPRSPREQQPFGERARRVGAALRARMTPGSSVARRKRRSVNPMFTNLNWHAPGTEGPLPPPSRRNDTLHIGSPGAAAKAAGGAREVRQWSVVSGYWLVRQGHRHRRCRCR